MTLSVITPSLNQDRYIERTIRSVLDQHISGLDYWVIDGGSTDETLNIFKRYDGLHWVSEPDRGHAHAVNKGLARTQGDVIGWLNSDDMYCPGALQTALDFFATHPDIDVLYGDALWLDENDAVLGRYPTEPWDRDRLLAACFLSQPATFFRRRVVERFGPLNESLNFSIDYEYWVRLALGGATFAYLPQTLAATRLHPAAKTRTSQPAIHRANNTFMRRHLGTVPDGWLTNYASALLYSRGWTEERPRRFAVALAVLTPLVALRWNRRVSRRLLLTSARWVGGNLRRKLR